MYFRFSLDMVVCKPRYCELRWMHKTTCWCYEREVHFWDLLNSYLMVMHVSS